MTADYPGDTAITPSSFVAVRNGALYCERRGRGPALVLLHPGSVGSRIWDQAVDVLAERFTTVRYDRRGLGRSTSAIAPYSEMDDLTAVLAALNVGQATLVGISDGGRIALEFAIRFPDAVDGLVVSGTSAAFEPGDQELLRAVEELRAALGVRDEAAEAGDTVRAIELDLDIWAQLHAGRDREDLMRLILERPSFYLRPREEFAIPEKEVTLSGVRSISVPTLLLVGEGDVRAAPIAAGRLAAALPDARQVVIPGADHYISTSAPDAFVAALRSFLDDRDHPLVG